MAIDSKIFFPVNKSSFTSGDTIHIGGAAFGARRVASVDVTLDEGATWVPATIRNSLDQDFTWVFWEAFVVPRETGSLTIQSRAISSEGTVQPSKDMDYLDGTNSWPSVSIQVNEGSGN
jgi:hypothetical protein